MKTVACDFFALSYQDGTYGSGLGAEYVAMMSSAFPKSTGTKVISEM